MSRQVDFNSDGYLLLHLDKTKITGYTSYGVMMPGNPQALVHESLLPEEFFNEFEANKFLYFSVPEKVVKNPDYVPPHPEDRTENPPKATLDDIARELKVMKENQEIIMSNLGTLSRLINDTRGVNRPWY